MNQFFLDELNCISKDITKNLVNSRFYCGNEINIIGDENGLSAYIAGFNMSVLDEADNGAVNVITEGGLRNKALYDEIAQQYGSNNSLHFFSDYDEYVKNTTADKIKRFYYVANLQLDEYKDEAFAEEKIRSLEKCFFLFILNVFKHNSVLKEIACMF